MIGAVAWHCRRHHRVGVPVVVASPGRSIVQNRLESTAPETFVAAPPTVASPASVWRAWTDRVLSTPLPSNNNNNNIDSLSLEQQRKQQQQQYDLLLRWWCRQRPLTTEAAATTWKLLDRAVAEWLPVVGEHKRATPSLPTSLEAKTFSKWLHLVLDHWRLSASHGKTNPNGPKNTTISPTTPIPKDPQWHRHPHGIGAVVTVPYSCAQVWDKLRQYHRRIIVVGGGGPPLVPVSLLSSRTYSMLLSALAYEGIDPNSSRRRPTSLFQHHSNFPGNLNTLSMEKKYPNNNHPSSNGKQTQPYMVLTDEILEQYQRDCRQPRKNSHNNVDTGMEAVDHMVVWNSALTVMAKQGRGGNAGHDAERILRRWTALNDDDIYFGKPNELSYALVLGAWAGTAESNPAAGENAERLFREMAQTLGTQKKQQQHARRRDDQDARSSSLPSSPYSNEMGKLIEKPQHDYNKNVYKSENDIRRGNPLSVEMARSICHFHVLRAWSNSVVPDGADRANCILQDTIRRFLSRSQADHFPNNCQNLLHQADDDSVSMMEDVLDDDRIGNPNRTSEEELYPSVKPIALHFNIVMDGYSQQGNLEKVQELLFQLQNLYDVSNGDPDFYPGTTVFNSLLESYAKQRTVKSALQAQELLERLYTAATANGKLNHDASYTPCLPDTKSVDACILAWAECGASDAPERAEALLLRTSEWPGVCPNVYSFTRLMKVWSKSSRLDAPERCEDILRHLWECHSSGTTGNTDGTGAKGLSFPIAHRNVKPNHVTYTTAIHCWARMARSNPSAPLRAEAIYQDMMERYGRGDHHLKPSLQIYSSLIAAWADCSRKESDLRAQFYFDQVRGQYLAGDESLRPTEPIYNAILSSKKKQHDGEGAERILKQMYNDFLNGNIVSCMPTRKTFRNVLIAWLTSSNNIAHQRIEAILMQMKNEHVTRKWDCKPLRDDFSVLLQSLAKVGSVASVERAEYILRDMCKSEHDDVRPDSKCYVLVFDMWVKQVNLFPDAPLRLQALFDDMKEHALKPNKWCYYALLTSWAKSKYADAPFRILAILNNMEELHTLDSEGYDAPDVFHFNTAISAFANSGDVENAERLLKRMINRSDLEASCATFRPILKAYSRYSYSFHHARQYDAYTKSKVLVEEMVRLSSSGVTGVAPDCTIFDILAAILCKTSSIPPIDKLKEVDFLVALMDHLCVRPSTGILQEIHKIQVSAGLK